MKRFYILVLLIVLLAVLVTPVFAKTTKYAFEDVQIGEMVVEIAASVKDSNNNQHTTCNYYTEHYDWLGQYQDATLAGTTAEEVLAFCIAHFDDRS